jgi:predicted SnoaL-like aldol condensation-catalyzing enzyme
MDAAELARIWIEAWSAGAPEGIPLTEDFTHTSPFGRIEGRETYLEFMQPMTGEGAVPLTIVRVIREGDEAVVHYEMHLGSGPVHACDWIRAADGGIAEIHSFYDATDMR